MSKLNSHTFLKNAAPFLTGQGFLNDVNDSAIGGSVSTVPSSVGASQWNQNYPGDRWSLDEDTAISLSDTTIGTLHNGFYMYIGSSLTSVATISRGHFVFWDTSVADDLYQVTPDESGAQGVGLPAGIAINTITPGNWGIIQISGVSSIKFRSVLTGVATNGGAVYLAAAGAGTDVGTVDQFAGDGNPATMALASTLTHRFMGTAQGLPTAGAISLVALKNILSYRM